MTDVRASDLAAEHERQQFVTPPTDTLSGKSGAAAVAQELRAMHGHLCHLVVRICVYASWMLGGALAPGCVEFGGVSVLLCVDVGVVVQTER